MRLTLSVYVHVEREEGRAIYHCRPLRGPQIATRDPLLSVALNKLGHKMRQAINDWIGRGEVKRVSSWLYDSETRAVPVKLMLALRDRTLRWKLLMVCMPAFSRLIAFSPSIPDVSFELDSLVELEPRAIEVYTRWAQDQLSDDHEYTLEGITGSGEMWIEPLEVEVETSVHLKKKSKNILAALFGDQQVSGSEELHKVGQCLDDMAHEFQPALGRGIWVDEIDRLLQRDDRQGVLIVGPPAVGKTAIIHECVTRRVARFHRRQDQKPQTWWLSPQRLVSGMSYLGQWEQRWLAILREASKRDHILVFDDLVGLFTAGRTRDSSLCAADVLRGFLNEHPLRILAESTAEQLAVLRRRDRALADRFHLVRIPALSADDALPIALQAVFELEIRSERYFHPESVPLIMRHQETFAPDQAFPGKAIGMCKTLTKHVDLVVDRRSVFQLAGAQLGANLRLLQGDLGDQQAIQQSLNRRLVGQPAAVEALSRTVIRFAQNLQAPDRPLGVLLLLGPTGVGKTEAAKALTRLLYTDESHLVRLDMNELTTPLAAEQLVGSFEQPDGRLTSAIRRQPNCVILLDEIEKAHPDVFDYLLQVLGEGRLTDARGRIADFRSSIIIMTSNLGATEQNSNLGFEVTAERRQRIYVRAAQQFFRPEFFNRIDEVVPFRSLDSSDMEQIVALQLEQVLMRDGLQRRELFVHVDDTAVKQVIQRGYDSKLGARAVRRMLEGEIIGPLADCLAALSIDHPGLVHIAHVPPQPSLKCQVLPLSHASLQSQTPLSNFELLIERSSALYARLDVRLSELEEELRAADRNITGGAHGASYYALREQLYRCSEALKGFKNGLRRDSAPMMEINPIAANLNRREVDVAGARRQIREWHAQDDLRAAVYEQQLTAEQIALPAAARQLVDHLSIASSMIDHALSPRTWLFGFESLTHNFDTDEFETGMASQFKRPAQFWECSSPVACAFNKLMDCLQLGWQYEVSKLHSPLGFRLVSGVSILGILHPLLGTYRVDEAEFRRPCASHLVSLRAIEVSSEQTPEELEMLVRQGRLLDGAGNLRTPREQPCPTSTIRGRINDSMLDSLSGSALELWTSPWNKDPRVTARTLQWWTTCLPVHSELREE
jgi:ATP-dependent Clp protease ATP-binding subunit ClpC